MADKRGFEHSELFLQWVWGNLLFDFTALQTTDGKELAIINPGTQNASDGPDFKQAVIEIDGLRWYGDVEIHTQSAHWKAHAHHSNPDYNTVILHVVAEETPKQVVTHNRAEPYTLNLLPYLPTRLQRFLKHFISPARLPCTSIMQFISEDVFYEQLEQAHTEYFEQKADDFLQLYDPEKGPAAAWKQALILALWDGLGIAHNRAAMQQTGVALIEEWDGNDITAGLERAYAIAGLDGSKTSINWNYKGVMPAGHPRKRIEQAVKISAVIQQEPFEVFLQTQALKKWKQWLQQAGYNETSRFKILFGTVFLPALYVLGSLFAKTSLSKAALNRWSALKTPIPKSIVSAYTPLAIQDKTYREKLGLVHQLRSYCRKGRCSECFVLKKAIES